MKGFIEVTNIDGLKKLINVNCIEEVSSRYYSDTDITSIGYCHNCIILTRLSYNEVVELIRKATED